MEQKWSYAMIDRRSLLRRGGALIAGASAIELVGLPPAQAAHHRNRRPVRF